MHGCKHSLAPHVFTMQKIRNLQAGDSEHEFWECVDLVTIHRPHLFGNLVEEPSWRCEERGPAIHEKDRTLRSILAKEDLKSFKECNVRGHTSETIWVVL